MNKEQRMRIKARLIKMMTEVFGDEMGKAVDDFYDDVEVELITTTCKPLVAHLVGKETAEMMIKTIIEEETVQKNM